jgi:hypothetical protein
MKKQTITLLLLCVCLASNSQKPITTDVPCTDAMAQNIKGSWIQTNDNGSYNSKETSHRLNEIHELVLNIYPQPTGVDAVWHRTAGTGYFGAKRKYYSTTDGNVTFDYLNLPHFTYYYYNVGFFPYQCEYGKTNSLIPTYPGETHTFLNIIANFTLGELAQDDTWTIIGLPVIMYKPPVTIKEGIRFAYPEPGRNVSHALVHRKGVLPYIPVTRKQYLDYCIVYHTKLHDAVIKNFEQMPVRSLEEQEKEKKAKLDKFQKQFGNDEKKLKANVDYYLSGYQTGQQRRDEQVAKSKKNKADELKKFTDELEKTTSEGLLDSTAMVSTKYYSSPVFETDPAKGFILVTENPEYIRKDLPKHVPQLFIVSLTWDDGVPVKKFAGIFQQDFSFEKLQAMIDK